MSEPSDGEGDHGTMAEEAEVVGQALYDTLEPMQTTVLNLFTMGLYHVFEQQVSVLYRMWSQASKRPTVELFEKLLRDDLGIEVERGPSYVSIRELQLVANVVKHTEGTAARVLRAANERYFREPLIRRPGFEDIPTSTLPTKAPLTGESVYVMKADYDAFVVAIIVFWEWLADSLEAQRIGEVR